MNRRIFLLSSAAAAASAQTAVGTGVIGVEPINGGSCFYVELPGSVIA